MTQPPWISPVAPSTMTSGRSKPCSSIVGSWANCSRSWSALNAGMFASPASASSPKAGATVSMSSALGSRKSNPFRRMPSAGKVSAREATSNTREVLVASAGQADEDQLRVETLDAGQSMGRLERRQDPFRPGQSPQCGERLVVCRLDVLGAPGVAQERVLGPDPRIVQPRRHRVRIEDLSVLVREQRGAGSVEDARPAV